MTEPEPEMQVVADAEPSALAPPAVRREFDALIEAGATLAPAGEAAVDPDALRRRYRPRYRVDLFGTRYYLTDARADDDLGFFVGYVVQPRGGIEGRVGKIWPRIFYKDVSLVWRVATHVVRTPEENWIGKGDVKWIREGREEVLVSAEETANLPLELQAAFDALSRLGGPPKRDLQAVPLILKAGGSDRIRPFADFSRPRQRAKELWVAHGGGLVARFDRPGDPASLKFVRGFEPDFDSGVLAPPSRSRSKLYGGVIRKWRVLSKNRLAQYQFAAGPRKVWINPPQTVTTAISPYGVRVDDIPVDDDLVVPAYEYHFVDDSVDPPRLHTQIPAGYAGKPSAVDPSRVDASRWIRELAPVQEFRAQVLKRGR